MAVIHYKTTPLTNLDTQPRVYPNRLDDGAYARRAFGTLASVTADSIGSTYRMLRVNSRTVVSELELANDAQGAAVTFDIGVYAAGTGGAVVDADHFASLVAVTSAGGYTRVELESGVVAIEDSNKPLWEALGLAEDPNVEYDITITVAGAAIVTGGDVALKATLLVLD